ncbi:MAG: cyclic nucleotide-binding domain-containing protein [Zoogloeaceae bacterium]|uniref:hemerythrin domain-containing protein n=1 Tax=Denitromonas sp. TaxID=2734609 RepID=UPI001D870912|nr:cyclic nucleotide-binding domain-containing protein [Rhodocyclaceae bacterium]MCP5221985.1 cyclic nucleotide-binding domain-containing protein [Zoogloeaceae bacterium]HPR08452.1 hemerythrin domain-containing protein [Denitromonas sp.]
MQIVAWNDSLKTDIDVVDQQHRGLVELVNATAAKLAESPELSADEVRLLLGYLTEYAQVHFSTEEALMALCGLEAKQSDVHHQSHARFLAQVGDMVEALGEDGVLDGQRLLLFLGDWLVDHIQGEDQVVARALRAAQASASPTAGPGSAMPTDGMGSWEARAQALMAPAATEPSFSDVVAQHSAALLASEAGVLEMCAHGEAPALIVSVDSALMPSAILHANTAAADFFGESADALCTQHLADVLAPDEALRFPVLVSEVLMAGRFEGRLHCRAIQGAAAPVWARLTHLALHGQMVLLVLLRPAVSEAEAAAAGITERLKEDSSVLSRHVLFQGLAKTELDGLESASRLLRIPKGKVVFNRGDAPHGVYLVISGQVKLAVSNARGAEKVMDIAGPLQVFGEADALVGSVHTVFAQALTASVLLLIPQAPLLTLLTRSLPFSQAVLAHLGQRYHTVAADLEAFALQTGMERVIHHLLAHARINGHGVLEAVLPAQKQVIASYLNLTPPTLSRTFQQLSEAGLIEMSGRYVRIPNKRRLLNFSTD